MEMETESCGQNAQEENDDPPGNGHLRQKDPRQAQQLQSYHAQAYMLTVPRHGYGNLLCLVMGQYQEGSKDLHHHLDDIAAAKLRALG